MSNIDRHMRNGVRIYGEWSGNPNGTRENFMNCIQGVYSAGQWIEHQCVWKRGHGPEGLYCKQHAKRLERLK